MTTTRTPATTPGGAPGDGRYRCDRAVSVRPEGTRWLAYDTRLGRPVLLQTTAVSAATPGPADRPVPLALPGLAPLLDAGVTGPGGSDGCSTWTVFPVPTGTAWAAVDDHAWRTTGTAAVASAAAWLVATVAHVEAAAGRTVALDIDDVVVDPQWFGPARRHGECPVQWMPFDAGGPDALPAVVDALGHHVERRARRRWAAAVDLLALPHGRRRAARSLAAIAGLDPRVLGLPALAPHRAGRERRPSGRRSSVGILPATTREDMACASAEAFS